MGPLQRRTSVLLATVAASSAFLTLGIACGSGASPSGAAKDPTSTPASSTTPGGDVAAPAGSVSALGPGSTTTALPPGGELQGAKLGSSTHTEIETKGDGGPKAGPGHAQEPGRRAEDIKAIITARRDQARACYDAGLKDHPGIEGNLTIRFVIDPQGTVTDSSVDATKSAIVEPSVGNCVADLIKKIKFAPSKGGFESRANYPFDFHPKSFSKADAGAK